MIDSNITEKRNVFSRFYHKMEAVPGKGPEIAILILYVTLLGVIAAFHEPWFDEAQAWQIAKCASLKDILLTIPHYEGHPPLWHLILLLPAKFGAPYELSIKAINIAICATACGLLILRSPFPRTLRLSLPFTYFLFYQYGVISRPYSLMFLAFVLAAAAYSKKDIKPLRFVLTLMLLCLSSAYGIVFAGGIAITWLIEMCGEQKLTGFIRSMLRDKRVWALLLLLLLALVNIWLIIPKDSTYSAASDYIQNDVVIRLLYTFIVLPADAWFFDCYDSGTRLQSVCFNSVSFAIGITMGLLLWFVFIAFSKKHRTTLLLLVPYFLYAVFGAFIYFYRHHIGTAALFLIFWAWVSEENKADGINISLGWLEKLMDSDPAGRYKLTYLFSAVIVFIIAMSVSWSAIASFNEIGTAYSYGRGTAEFLKIYGLEELNIMVGWKEVQNTETGEIVSDTNYTAGGIALLPYFDTNIISDVNNGDDSLAYNLHKRADDETNLENLENWASRGIPDVLIGFVDLDAVYGDTVTMADYAPVYDAEQFMLWKTNIPYKLKFGGLLIYVRRDLLQQYGLLEIETDNIIAF